MATRSNVEIALDSIKRIGSFSEGEKDAMTKAFRTAMFPGNWSIGTPNDNDVLLYDAADLTWKPESLPGGTWLSLADTPGAFAASNQIVRANAGQTALEFHIPVVTDNSDVTVTAPSAGEFMAYNGGAYWENVTPAAAALLMRITTTKGDIVVDPGTGPVRLAIGTDTHVLTADSAQANGLKWAVSPSGFADPMTTRGDVIVRDATNTTARLAVGANTFVLTSDGTDASWSASLAGATAFTGLSDVPYANYVTHGLKLLRVNAAETDIEFVTGGSITQVTGTLPMASSGGTTPDISIRASTPSVSGYMSATQANKLDQIENLADVTDTANVTAAGAWMGEVFIQSGTPAGVDGDIWYEI